MTCARWCLSTCMIICHESWVMIWSINGSDVCVYNYVASLLGLKLVWETSWLQIWMESDKERRGKSSYICGYKLDPRSHGLTLSMYIYKYLTYIYYSLLISNMTNETKSVTLSCNTHESDWWFLLFKNFTNECRNWECKLSMWEIHVRIGFG